MYSKNNLAVIGAGAPGGTIINTVMAVRSDIDFVILMDDRLDIDRCHAPIKIFMERNHLTLDGDAPERGRECFRAYKEQIDDTISKYNGIIITGGLGGNIGSGVIPEVLKVTNSKGIYSIAVVTTPFSFESRRRQMNAVEALQYIKEYADDIVIIDLSDILKVVDPGSTMIEALKAGDEAVRDAIVAIIDNALHDK